MSKDIFNGEHPHELCLAVSYIETDDNGRCTPRIYLTDNETLWFKKGEDIYGKLNRCFESVERMILANKKHGQICFLTRGHFFYSSSTKLTIDERIDLLKGCRFSRDQIADIRRIVGLCEQVLDEEEKEANDQRGNTQ